MLSEMAELAKVGDERLKATNPKLMYTMNLAVQRIF
jgi:hypothetical protein